ncbi:DUF11 domain-containing protein [Microbacterium sp. CFH 90308]|uniref:DUF11 domain-containing protein n=1 Tax=Microbacterium salsuginis TaxID=2722803 RepID=A0ABX1KCM6_9MICO|nr:SpaA isopeptide-forming pilin-related protein [Microbacterium sp. CFH 90308]NLP84380.1 DUF11 domain-containing protein [Microbacterium sp. CFH 90308]
MFSRTFVRTSGGVRRGLREQRTTERKIALQKRWWVGGLAAIVAGSLVFTGVSPAVAEEVTPSDTATTEQAAPTEETAPDATTPAPEEPAVEEPAAEAPPAEDPAPPTEPTETETEVTDAAKQADAAPEVAPEVQTLAAEDIGLLALPCEGWPVAGSPVAGFEIDGNLCLDGDGTLDWATVGGQPVADDGYDDSTQFTQGASENDWPWTLAQTQGQNAQGKSDIGNVYAYTQTVGGDIYAYLGFERAENTGSVSYHVELNQLANSFGPVPNRTVGDLRLTIEQTGNNTIALVDAEVWDGDSWESLGSTGGFVGQVNQGDIDNLSGEVREAGTFAEIAINITDLFEGEGCSGNFGVLNVRSSASPEDTSALSDWVAPISVNVPSTCATLTIFKTDPDGGPLAGAEFSISPNPVTGTGSTTGTTNAKGEIVFSGNVLPGQYTITETAAPPGYLLDTTPQVVTLGDAESKTVTFVDPLGSVSWLKHDRAGQLLGGATFAITATGGAAAAAPWADDFPMTVVDNGLNDADPDAGEILVEDLPTGDYSVAETAAPANYVLDPTPKAFSITQEAPHPSIQTPFVNTPFASVTLTKVWVNSFAGDQADIAIGGDAAANGTSTAPTNGPVIQVAVAPGSDLTLAETLAGTNAGLYTSTLSCVGATVSNNTGTAGAISVPDYPASQNGVQCTFTNTAVERTVTLQKRWVDAIEGDTAELNAGGDVATSTATGAPGTVTDIVNVAEATVRVGDSVALSEILAGTGTYSSVYECSAGTTTGTGTGTSFSLTVPNEDVVCTFTNTAQAATVTLVKQWVNAFANDEADLSITGAKTDAETSVATEGNSTDNAHAATVSVRLGEKVTLSETLPNTNTGDYTTTWSCSDNTNGTGTSIPEITVSQDVTCTIVNTAKEIDVSVDKKWVNAFEGDSATLSIDGQTGESIATGVMQQLDTDVVTATVRVGDEVTVGEVFGDNQGTYDTSIVCTGVEETVDGLSASFTAPDGDVVCTFTNTAKTVDVTLEKAWIDGVTGDSATLSADLASGDPVTDVSTVTAETGPTFTDGVNVVTIPVRVGDTVAMSETVEGIGTYTSTYACTVQGTTGDGTGRSFSLTVPDSDVVCTFTNAAQKATITLIKQWVNAFAGDEADLSITGAATDASTSVATEGNSTDNANAATVTVRLGEKVTLSESLPNTNTGEYSSTWSCSDNANGTGTSIPEITVTGPVTCTIVNTAKEIDVTVDKVWVNAFAGDSATLSIDGTTGESIATGVAGSETDAGVVTETVRIGDEVTVSEVLGDNQGMYDTMIACTGADETVTDLSATFTAVDADVVCTFTNTAKTVDVTLYKKWIDGLTGDTATLSADPATGDSASDVSTVIAETGPTFTDTANAVTVEVRVGDVVDMAEVVEGDGVYVSTFACEYGTTTSDDPTNRSFQLEVTGDQDIECWFVNESQTAKVHLVKTWVNGQAGDTAELSIDADTTVTDTSTSTGTVGEFTDVANAIVADATIGSEVTVEELIEVVAGDPADYTSGLMCWTEGDTVVLDVDAREGSFTMPDEIVWCEFVNTAERPTLSLVKVVDGAPVSDTNWQLFGTPEEGDVVTNPAGGDVAPTPVLPGDPFALTEEVIGDMAGLDEFEMGMWSCVSDDSGAIALTDSEPGAAMLRGLDKGEHVVCTIVNEHVDQGIEFDKELVGSVQNEDGSWTVTYEIIVRNNSVVVPVEYDLIDTLDEVPGIEYTSASWTGPTSGSFDLDSSLTADLAVGQELAPRVDGSQDVYTVVVDLEVHAPAVQAGPCEEGGDGIGIVNTATVTAGEHSDTDDACGTVHYDDLDIEKTASSLPEGGTVKPGDTFDYVLTVTSNGTRDAVDAIVRDEIPEGLKVTAVAMPEGWVNENAPDLVDADNVLSVRVPAFGVDDVAEIVVTVEVVAAKAGGTIVNTACVATELDRNPDNDCSTVEVPVRPAPPAPPAPPVPPVLPATGGGQPAPILVVMGLLAMLTGATALVVARRRRGEAAAQL